MKLYKYISSKYLDSIIKKGQIRFNSLHYYRTIEDKNRQADGGPQLQQSNVQPYHQKTPGSRGQLFCAVAQKRSQRVGGGKGPRIGARA